MLSNHLTLTFSHRDQRSVLYICVSLAAQHVGYWYQLSKFHIYVLTYRIWLSVSDLLHSV